MNTDLDLPPVGLGTMGLDGDEGAAAVETALRAGYRHFDTAQVYENEATVGAGLAAALDGGGGDRDAVTVATKTWIDRLAPEDVRPSTEASLDRLGLDAVDLLYVHRPKGGYDPAGTLAAFDALVDDGLAGHVGVSNFDLDELDEAIDLLDAPLAAHQTEYHPLFRRPALREHAVDHGYPLVAYSPLAGGRVREVDAVRAVATKHDATPEAVSIAWLTGKEGVVTVPKASSEAHLRANLPAADLDLEPEDEARIDAVEREAELFPE
ncbi:aldo/keto reductase [Halobaculum gomorrense]|uniref:2,5-diketo-D-gluconate reductase B n=1 Tax=Halobaculum gomorrense TaxID=43928 RepID=A0A1M5MDW8_9EURY|nr:aldo/keto reductase [Halobaculum gomorrense]SHG75401.1 2,5-diketo-D-gluconate reductase B [Halobaculum gomorrense]